MSAGQFLALDSSVVLWLRHYLEACAYDRDVVLDGEVLLGQDALNMGPNELI